MKLPFWKRHTLYFVLSLVVVVLISIYLRPLRSAWQPFIAGDGLGYYAYLPAKFIHNDPQLDFKWFNGVYAANYPMSSFDNAEDNFMVAYNGKRINKYYTGLSFIWFPFFVVGHLVAKLFHYPPDGFSAPYQWAMGLACLFYLVLGLLFLRGLLYQLFHFKWVATLVPLLFFLGTPLFTYAIFFNTLSHVYSFCFTAGFLYYTVLFFRSPHLKTRHLILALLFFTIGVCIRPLNGLLIFCLPAFVPKSFSFKTTVFEKLNLVSIVLLLVALAAALWQVYITKLQTNQLFAYTYTDEHFDFKNARFVDALFSYHQGLFVYAPLLLISLFGFLVFDKRAGLLLLGIFFGVIFIYSAWWYWPILKRVIIDWYVLPAITLAALLSALKQKIARVAVLTLLFISVAYFQLKALQIQRGILDEFLTDKTLYWRNFTRLSKASIYAVPEKSIIDSQSFTKDFEIPATDLQIVKSTTDNRTNVLQIDSVISIYKLSDVNYPNIFRKKGGKKLKLSFDLYANTGFKQAQVLVKLMSPANRELKFFPFYLDTTNVQENTWDYKEFGLDMPSNAEIPADSIARIQVFVWNISANTPLYIDNYSARCILTNTYFETIK